MGGDGRHLAGATVGRTKGLGTHKSTAQAGKLKEGGPEPLGHLGCLGTRVGADGVGPAVAPPGAGVKRAGGTSAARAGTGPASSRPRLLARSPPPRAREGKGRERGRERPDAGVSPASRRGTGTLGSGFAAFSTAGSSSSSPQLPGAQLLPPPARGTHVGLPHPNLVESHPPPLPLRLDSSLSPFPSIPRCGGLPDPSGTPFLSPPPLSRSTFPTLSLLSVSPFPRPSILGLLGARFLSCVSSSHVHLRSTQGTYPGIPGTPGVSTSFLLASLFLRPRAPSFPAFLTPSPALSLPHPLNSACSWGLLQAGPLSIFLAPPGFALPSFSVLL